MIRACSALFAWLALAGCAVGGEPGPCRHHAPVAWSGEIPVEGAALHMVLRGERCDAPLLVWVHGGPGAAARPLYRLYNRAFERQFVVAYYDQRGAGRSWDPAADPAALTIARHLADLDRVLAFLSAALGQDRAILVGHSWGGALALLHAARDPADVRAVVAVTPLVDGLETERLRHAFVAEAARDVGDAEALGQLAAMGPPPVDASQARAVEALVDRFGGLFHTRPNFTAATAEALLRGYETPSGVVHLIRANDASLTAMREETLALDLSRSAPSVAVPVIFALGRHDRHVDARLSAAYAAALVAPDVRVLWFERSAHNPPFEEPEAFVRRVADALAAVGAAP